METKSKSISCTTRHSYGVVFAAAVVLQLGASAGYAQTGDYLYTGSKTTITLNPGTYTITAYGAQGGSDWEGGPGGLGAEMEGEFYFSGQTTLTLLVGGAGGNGRTYQGGQGGGGGGGSFVANGSTALLVAGGGSGSGASGSAAGSTGTSGQYGGTGGGGGGGGFISNGYGNGPDGTSFLNGGYGGSNGGFGGGGGGGQPEKGGGGGGYSGGGAGGFSLYNFAFGYGGAAGGSIVDSSAISDLTEISGVASPDGLPDGEIIILAVPEPSTIALGLLSGLGGLWTVRRRRAA